MLQNPLGGIPLERDSHNLCLVTLSTQRVAQALGVNFRAATNKRHLDSSNQHPHRTDDIHFRRDAHTQIKTRRRTAARQFKRHAGRSVRSLVTRRSFKVGSSSLCQRHCALKTSSKMIPQVWLTCSVKRHYGFPSTNSFRSTENETWLAALECRVEYL